MPAIIKAPPSQAISPLLASTAMATTALTFPAWTRSPTSSRRCLIPGVYKWATHFRYQGGELIGRTAIGRTTVEVLRINLPNFVALREVLMDDRLF